MLGHQWEPKWVALLALRLDLRWVMLWASLLVKMLVVCLVLWWVFLWAFWLGHQWESQLVSLWATVLGHQMVPQWGVLLGGRLEQQWRRNFLGPVIYLRGLFNRRIGYLVKGFVQVMGAGRLLRDKWQEFEVHSIERATDTFLEFGFSTSNLRFGSIRFT